MFDWEVDDKVEQPVNPKNLVYEELRAFFKTRYKVLEEEINSFQKENEIGFVVIVWHDDGAVETKGFNIPPHLKDKLRNCISEDDMNYIMDVIWLKIQDEKRKN